MLPSQVKLVMKKSTIDGLGILKGFITMLSIHDNVYIENNPESIVGNYDTILDNKFIYKPSSDREEWFYTCRMLILNDEKSDQKTLHYRYDIKDPSWSDSIFATDTFIDWFQLQELICEKVKNRIFKALDKLIIKDIITQEVDKITHEIVGKTMAISVRTWTATHESNINRPYSFELYKEKINEILTSKEINTIVISLDNDIVKKEYEYFFKKNYGQIKLVFLTNEGGLNYLQFSMVKMLAMSKCDILLGNRLSNYTDLIFWFSRCKINVFTVE
jgi:hypothetical protein